MPTKQTLRRYLTQHLLQPPRERGKPAPGQLELPLERFIPARAGKTCMVTTRPALLPVHPRASGENYNDDFDDEDDSGSSPLARGKRAYVMFWVETRLAHPRASGENGERRVTLAVATGSSPLARGKPRQTVLKAMPTRLIPARAGKTCFNVSYQAC